MIKGYVNNYSQVNRTYIISRLAFLLLSSSILFSCSDSVVKDSAPSPASVDPDSIPDATPRPEPRSKYGNPDSYVVFGKRYHVMKESNGFNQRGIASWYGKKFHGRKTSNGETYDMYAMTAAHKSLPIPTYVEVTNLKNNKQVIVRVNDRGPFHENRIIDLSYTAARKLDIVAEGTGLVEIRVLEQNRVADGGKMPVTEDISVSETAVEAGIDHFYIQVGAFGKLDNATRFQTRVASLSKSLVEISEATVNEKKIFRVQIGPLHNVDIADRIVRDLTKQGIAEHRIVVR
jgi:rare lipoprotein A